MLRIHRHSVGVNTGEKGISIVGIDVLIGLVVFVRLQKQRVTGLSWELQKWRKSLKNPWLSLILQIDLHS